MSVRSTKGIDFHGVHNPKRNYKFNLNDKKRLLLLAESENYSDNLRGIQNTEGDFLGLEKSNPNRSRLFKRSIYITSWSKIDR